MAFGSNTSKWYFVGDSSSLEKATKRSEDSLGRLNATGKKAFGQLSDLASGFGLAVGVGGLAVGVGKAISAASDLGEQINKTAVVFRGSEQQIQAWSETTSKAFGISQRAALEAAGTFGNMLVPMGFARDRAAEMSERMVELAADMASFNNADPSEVLEALRSGLAGETEPLRRFGVFLSDARLKQEALSLGLYDGKGALDAQAKAAATYAVILKDTGDAQGDFGRTSDSLANSQRILRAQFEDAAAKLGNALIPAATKLVEVLNGAIPVVEGVVRKIDSLVDKLGGWKVAAGFILSGLFASRILAIVEAMKALAVATAAAGTASTVAAGGTLAAWGKLGTFLRFGLAGAAAVGVIEMRKPIGDFFDWMTRKLEGILGWIPGYSVKKAEEAVQAVDLRSKELMPLAGQTAGGLFYTGWHERFRLSLRTGKMELRDDIAGPLSEAGDQAGDQAGEETAKAFTLSLTAFLRVKFPTMANAALAPTWQDIARAAEAAGIDVGNAFVSGYASAVVNASTGTNQFANVGSYAVAPGQQLQGTIFPIAAGVSTSIIGTPGSGTHNQTDWQSRNAIDIAATPGTPVLAVEDGTIDHTGGADPARGTVETSSGKKLYGWSVTLNGVSGTQYFYTHLDKLAVSAGDTVKAGDVIGLVAAWKGGTAHVHFATSKGDPRNIGNRVKVDYVPPPPSTKTPGTSSPTSPGSTTTPRAKTSFPAIAGISDSLQGRFDAANQPEGEALRYDPKTKKWVAVKVGPDMKALKRLADHLRTKVLPGLQKRIDVLKKRIGRLVKKKADGVLIQTLRNKLAALQDERDEIVALWREIIDTWKDLKEAAEEDDDTGPEPTQAYDYSGPVGGQPGLPGHETPDPTPPDTTPDLRAELDQANRRAAASARAAQLSGAFVSSLGIGVDANGNATVTAPGGVTVNMSMAFPPSPEQAVLIGQAVAKAASGQGFQPSTAESLGV